MILTEQEVDIMVEELLYLMKIEVPTEWSRADDFQFIEDTKVAFVKALQKCNELSFPYGQEKYI